MEQQLITHRIPPRLLRLLLNVWPPFLGARIKVREMDRDMRRARVEMPLSRANRNPAGTHFGGSLFAMTDPFFVLMLSYNLPAGTIIWDKASSIEFVAPGRGRVRADMSISEADLAQIRRALDGGEKHLHVFKAEIVDDEGLTVARVEKIVYLRRRVAERPPAVAAAALRG